MMKELSPDILAAVAQRLEDQSKRTFIDLEDLIRTTKFSKQEIRTMYRGFKQECPGGAVNEDTFREIYEKFFPYGNAACYAHHVFKAFDVNSTGAISFRDMLVSLSTLLHGTQYEKLKWTFRVYDLNGDGVITKTGSVLNIDYIPRRRDSVSTEDKSWIPPLNLTISVRELRDNVETIFTRLDTNRDGVVTREEFVQSCLQDSTISSSLQNFQFKL
ncbi:Kv channel-interacting protein 1 isoform X2 [Eurytemora carolleeae]|uniref:Kv channel-interacting protein 1 isoform X2 n=1 Tax=Eurytemora carolleeae TaxID=1294199 RepID=UPI000C76BE37|nr:Kv channel-interacting protein 1 isoform X2 [Eurytemora carolleeae]|eukprot:XP_023330478.1 Kv channel-interacting protein 1-like isoform X2 [Eurytemora affinis]